jgi:hypothetical protein
MEHLAIAMLYSDGLAALKTIEIQQRVLQQFEPNLSVVLNSWPLASLNDAAQFEISHRQAAKADVLFLAISDASGPLDQLNPWLDLVLTSDPNHSHSRALIVLLGIVDQPSDGHDQLVTRFREQAASAGIDCFVHYYETSPDQNENPPSSPPVIEPGKEPRWGINE